jgi:NADH-quinone oxidoreductase subunit J
MQYFLFFFFSVLLLFSALMVISGWNANPVQAVLFLILCFCNASALLILLEVEYMALIFLMVYVGAIAILFLFVVMMLDLKVERNRDWQQLLPVGISVVFLFFSSLVFIIQNFKTSSQDSFLAWIDFVKLNSTLAPENQLGCFLYTYGSYWFLLSGIILLVAIIGCISLTQQEKLYYGFIAAIGKKERCPKAIKKKAIYSGF